MSFTYPTFNPYFNAESVNGFNRPKFDSQTSIRNIGQPRTSPLGMSHSFNPETIQGFSRPTINPDSIKNIPKPLTNPKQELPAPKGMPKLTSGIQAATGGLQLLGQAKAMGDEADSIDTSAPESEYDAYGRPKYNIGGFAVKTGKIKPKGASGGEVASATAQGAAAGAAFGGVGAIIGAGFGAITSWIGGARRKRKMREAKRKARRSLRRAQRRYNAGVTAANQQELVQEQYMDSMNNTDRMFNLYNTEDNV